MVEIKKMDDFAVALKRFKEEEHNHFTYITAKSHLAPLDAIAWAGMNRDTARKVFGELMTIARKISDDHKFSLTLDK